MYKEELTLFGSWSILNENLSLNKCEFPLFLHLTQFIHFFFWNLAEWNLIHEGLKKQKSKTVKINGFTKLGMNQISVIWKIHFNFMHL